MTVLSPTQAAMIADAAYRTESHTVAVAQFGSRNPFALNDIFEIQQQSLLNGKSGPALLPTSLTESGFGYVAKGKGAFDGDVLIAFRGTNALSGRDLWTDGNFSVQLGPRGFGIHGGFNNTFNLMLPSLREQLRGLNPARVHLVGHSLGGALATVSADWCVANNIGQVNLYTFGSPRVGMREFAGELTAKASAPNIYRVYHTSDVVSMVPLFPFMHVPLPGLACGVARNGLLGMPLSISTHLMPSYVRDVAGKDWNSLREAAQILAQQKEATAHLQRLLAEKTQGRHSAAALYLVNNALAELMDKAGATLGVGLMSGMTVLDRMAWALQRLSQKEVEYDAKIRDVLNLAVRFLGLQALKIGRLTVTIIREVLYRLAGVVYNMARMAVEATQ